MSQYVGLFKQQTFQYSFLTCHCMLLKSPPSQHLFPEKWLFIPPHFLFVSYIQLLLLGGTTFAFRTVLNLLGIKSQGAGNFFFFLEIISEILVSIEMITSNSCWFRSVSWTSMKGISLFTTCQTCSIAMRSDNWSPQGRGHLSSVRLLSCSRNQWVGLRWWYFVLWEFILLEAVSRRWARCRHKRMDMVSNNSGRLCN